MQSALNWKVTGAAGEGIKSTGLLFSKTCLRHGLYTFDYTDYPSLIRGGHNTYQVKAASGKVYSQEKDLDILIALNQNGLKLHVDELTESSVIVSDLNDLGLTPDQLNLPGSLLNIPLMQLAKDTAGDRLMANNVALGASMYLLGLELKILESVIADIFKDKGSEVVDQNRRAAHAGFDFAQETTQKLPHIGLTNKPASDNLSLTGNDALALGAVAGGLKAYFAYPMTPSSSILHTLASWAKPAELMVKHAEDEIGVINMALGASYAGVRTAVGTSGGGFTYMTEALGLSGVAELPLVIYECQRPGPALGMPTWTAQADLLFVTFASQDEFPRIVLSPGDVKEAFELSKLAFELAEKYQIPVIVLSDKHLSESSQSTHFKDSIFSNERFSLMANPQPDDTGFFPRYADTPSGVSPRPLPGQKGGFHIANSYEAETHGLASEESAVRIQQMNKRMRKFDQIKKEIPQQFYDGSDHPQVTFFSFGSTKTAVQAGIEQLRATGIDAAGFNLSWIWPFPVDQVRSALEQSQNPIIVEGNYMNQLARLIRQETGIDIYHKRTRYDGRPFYPHQIVQFAKEVLGN